jgi:hypothetical protein
MKQLLLGQEALDPDLPQPFNPKEVKALIDDPPFTRAVNLSDSLLLTGMAYVEGKPVVSVLDRETKKTHTISEEPNELGWRVVEAPPSKKLSKAQIKIQIGAETVTVRYNQDGIAETLKDKKATPPSSSGSDRGPREDRGPKEEDRGFRRSMRGPTEEDRKRFEALSSDAQEKVRNIFRDSGFREKMINMSDDERRTYLRSQVDKIEAEDKKTRK